MRCAPRLLLALTLLPASCGDNDTDSGTIAWIEIAPGSLLLTPDRGSAALEAIAYDADGNKVDASFTWRSSTPDQIDVDSSGMVTAVAALGSATVSAAADGVRSNPIVVAMVELHPGTLVVTDDQVVDAGEPFLPDGAAPEDFPQLDVRLRDVAVPAPGTILVSAESAPVGGAVVSAEEDGGEVAVRLQLVSLPEMFARYDIDWQIGLTGYSVEVDEDATAARETLAAVLPVEKKIEKQWPPKGPFRCTGSVTAYLEKNTVDLKLVGDAKFVFKSSRSDESLPPGYLKVALEGPLTLKGSLALRAKAGLRGSGKCELRTRIPIALGAFAIVVAPAIPLGVGVSLSANLKLASMELGFEGENGFDLGLGFECGPAPVGCHSLDKADPINRFKPLLEVPRGMKDMRVEMSAKAYFLTGVDLLFGLGTWPFEAVEVTVGPVQSADLGFVDNQADDKGYASKYDLKLEGKASLGSGAEKAIKKLLGKDEEEGSVGLELSISSDLSKSPVGRLTSDKQQTSPHKKVRFTVDLEADSLMYFLIGWNVKSILFYRRKVDEPEPTYELMKELEVSSSGTRFTWDWTPMNGDVGKWEFFAFVKTALPVIELEIANDSSRMVEVQGICSGSSALAGVLPGGGSSGCELVGSVSHTVMATTPIGQTTTTASASLTMQEDPTAGTDGLVGFRPYGTWSATHGGTMSGCTVTVQPSPMQGTLDGNATQGVIFVHTDGENEALPYEGLLATGEFPVTTTLSCPGQDPYTTDQIYDFDLFSVMADQGLVIDPVTRKAMGSYTRESNDGMGTTVSHTWTWDLTLQTNDPPPPPP